MKVPKNSLDACRVMDDPNRLAYPPHSCPKPVGESLACAMEAPSAAAVIVCTEILLSTNNWNFCPGESGSELAAMSGKTMDFLCSRLYKAKHGTFDGAIGVGASAGLAV